LLRREIQLGDTCHNTAACKRRAAKQSTISREQLDILDHTEHRAPGGFFCGGGPDMDALVAAGLMEFAGRKSFVPDAYYRITSKGRAVLRSPNDQAHRPPTEDK
jgi:hypothetical protein